MLKDKSRFVRVEDVSLDKKGEVPSGSDLVQCEGFPLGAVDGPGWFTTELYNLTTKNKIK